MCAWDCFGGEHPLPSCFVQRYQDFDPSYVATLPWFGDASLHQQLPSRRDIETWGCYNLLSSLDFFLPNEVVLGVKGR